MRDLLTFLVVCLGLTVFVPVAAVTGTALYARWISRRSIRPKEQEPARARGEGDSSVFERNEKPRETCGTCAHFDLDAGQKIQADHPIFMQAAAVIPPHRMGTAHDDHGKPLVPPDVATLKTSWGDVGLCLVEDPETGSRELVASLCEGCPKNSYKPQPMDRIGRSHLKVVR